ncbi:MAG: hypothetical protein ACK5MN_12370 [Lachnospiraceae bacterium]
MTETTIILKVLVPIGTALIGGIIGFFLTHIFYKSKLRKEQKVRFENVVGDQIALSLMETRKLELMAGVIEIFNIEGSLKEKGSSINFFGVPGEHEAYYLEITGSIEKINSFSKSIADIRRNHEPNLDRETTSYLVLIDRYMMTLRLFLSEAGGGEEIYPTWGTIFFRDIQRWQKKFDGLLIEKINSAPCVLEPHNDEKYQKIRDKVLDELWKTSILYKLTNGIDDKEIQLLKPFILDLIKNT